MRLRLYWFEEHDHRPTSTFPKKRNCSEKPMSLFPKEKLDLRIWYFICVYVYNDFDVFEIC